VFGSSEGRDGSDLIEWVAAQEWSNGKVGLAGDSWLAVSQWFTAAEQPPHLACIAPWEGFVDVYQSFARPGGIMQAGLMGFIASFIGYGPGRVEDIVAMAEEHPFMDADWEDKVARHRRTGVCHRRLEHGASFTGLDRRVPRDRFHPQVAGRTSRVRVAVLLHPREPGGSAALL
jgi:putative CocE/NonD family hydrolase